LGIWHLVGLLHVHVHILHLRHHLLHLELHLLHLGSLLVLHHVWVCILVHAGVWVLHLHVLHLGLNSVHLIHHLLLVCALILWHLLTKLLLGHACILLRGVICAHDVLERILRSLLLWFLGCSLWHCLSINHCHWFESIL
jgi:hypothetical protein